MSIRTSVRASLLVALLAPALASANGGVIRFVGAIVEPSSCMPRVTQASPGAHPKVACAPVGAKATLDPALRVRTHVQALPSDSGLAQRAPSNRYLVTLEYL